MHLRELCEANLKQPERSIEVGVVGKTDVEHVVLAEADFQSILKSLISRASLR